MGCGVLTLVYGIHSRVHIHGLVRLKWMVAGGGAACYVVMKLICSGKTDPDVTLDRLTQPWKPSSWINKTTDRGPRLTGKPVRAGYTGRSVNHRL